MTPKKADGEQRAARRASECAGAGIGVRGGSDSAGKPCGRADSRSDVWGKGRVEAMPSSAFCTARKVDIQGKPPGLVPCLARVAALLSFGLFLWV